MYREYNCIIDLQMFLICLPFYLCQLCLNIRGCSEMKGHRTHRYSNVADIVFSTVSLPWQLTFNLAFYMLPRCTMKLHNVHRQLVVKTVLASQTWRLAQTRAEGFFSLCRTHVLSLVETCCFKATQSRAQWSNPGLMLPAQMTKLCSHHYYTNLLVSTAYTPVPS